MSSPFHAPFPQNPDKNTVQPPVEDADKRVAAPRRHPKRPAKQPHGKETVRPGVQGPLILPNPRGIPAERPKVINRPQITRAGTARTDKIAQQVQVEDKQREPEHLPSVSPEQGQNSRAKQRCRQSMRQPMVVFGVIIYLAVCK
jgi:hypothetical protein